MASRTYWATLARNLVPRSRKPTTSGASGGDKGESLQHFSHSLRGSKLGQSILSRLAENNVLHGGDSSSRSSSVEFSASDPIQECAVNITSERNCKNCSALALAGRLQARDKLKNSELKNRKSLDLGKKHA